MGRSNGLVLCPLPKHSWPGRQKEKLDQPAASDPFLSISSMMCQQMKVTMPQQERTRVFHYLTEAVQTVCDMKEFVNHLSFFRDMNATKSPGESRGSSKPRHRAVAVGYNPLTLSHSEGSLFSVDSPIPNVEYSRTRRHDATMEASFLLVGDGASRAFRGSAIPIILQNSLLAMGRENLNLIDPMKAFQGSSLNHVGCPLGLLSHLTFIYQCEIRDDGKVTLSVLWVKLLHDDDDEGSNVVIEDGTYRLQYCKASIDSFNVMDPRQAAKLFAWIHSIAQWSLKERLEALRVARQLDEVRRRRVKHANISLLQEFGADPSMTWLSEQTLKAIPGPSTLGRSNVRVDRAPTASRRSKSLEPRTKKEQTPTTPMLPLRLPPRLPPQPPASPPAMTRKGLLPAYHLAGGPNAYGSSLLVPNRSQTSSTSDTVISPSQKKPSADKLIASVMKDKKRPKELAERLMLMTAIYDAILQNPKRGELAADTLPSAVPVSVS